jgi:uncharacterized RDD family membrane protein YckC
VTDDEFTTLPARLTSRLAAAVFDWLLLLFVFSYIFSFLQFQFSAYDDSSVSLVFFLLAWVYFAGFESSAWKATPFKRREKIWVCHVDGSRITFWRASLRFAGKLLVLLSCGLGLLTVFFGKDRRTLDDLISSTRVVSFKKIEVERAKAESMRRWHTYPGVWFATAFILITLAVYLSLNQTTKLTGENTPERFRVVVETGAAKAPESKLIDLKYVAYERDRNEFLTLNLAPGKRELTYHNYGNEKADVSFNVTALSEGIQVDALFHDEWANFRYVYRVKDDKVTPELYEIEYPGAIFMGLFASTIFTFILYPVYVVLRWVFNKLQNKNS